MVISESLYAVVSRPRSMSITARKGMVTVPMRILSRKRMVIAVRVMAIIMMGRWDMRFIFIFAGDTMDTTYFSS